MIAEGIQSGGRNRVHSVRADELFDIENITVLRVLGAGAGPKQPLGLRAFGRKHFPARTTEKFVILFVGKPGIGNGHLAAETFEQSSLAGVCGGLESFIDFAVNKSIDAADEEACNAGNVADVLALCSASLDRKSTRLNSSH